MMSVFGHVNTTASNRTSDTNPEVYKTSATIPERSTTSDTNPEIYKTSATNSESYTTSAEIPERYTTSATIPEIYKSSDSNTESSVTTSAKYTDSVTDVALDNKIVAYTTDSQQEGTYFFFNSF